MDPLRTLALSALLAALALPLVWAEPGKEKVGLGRLDVDPPHVSADPAVRLDYAVVYVRTLLKEEEL